MVCVIQPWFVTFTPQVMLLNGVKRPKLLDPSRSPMHHRDTSTGQVCPLGTPMYRLQHWPARKTPLQLITNETTLKALRRRVALSLHSGASRTLASKLREPAELGPERYCSGGQGKVEERVSREGGRPKPKTKGGRRKGGGGRPERPRARQVRPFTTPRSPAKNRYSHYENASLDEMRAQLRVY